MTKLLSTFLFGVLLASAGCQKSADLDRFQQETLIDVQAYADQLERVQQRADALMKRGREIASAPGVNEAGKRLTEARARTEQLRGLVQSAPTALSAATQTGFEALKKSADELAQQLRDGLAFVRADLDAVENWVASAEHARQAIAQAPAPAAPDAEPAAPTDPAADPAADPAVEAPATN